MNENIKLNTIDGYIDEVRRYIPYTKEKTQEAINEFQIDVEAAMADTESKPPSTVFGSPRDVALNIIESHPEWYSKRAGWWLRLGAYLLDFFIEMIFLLIYLSAGFLLLITFNMPLDELMQEFDERGQESFQLIDLFTPEKLLLIIFITFLTITTVMIFLGYNAVLEYYFGATPGKRLLNLLVVDQTGIRISWKQAIIRNVSKILISEELLPFDVVLGMILEKFDPEKTQKQRGLDILAETIVIKQ
ncbi:MAG: RDD family protein [Candidatus Heimdallarchaeota archaeon]|nr:MAG: RDD family protein [Candidatus Heimdallarchaeota archaeon]